jgi:HPt (histidine-containing phosphotransfer) domain-containing protein
MDDYLSKPINPESLVATLAKYIRTSPDTTAPTPPALAQPEQVISQIPTPSSTLTAEPPAVFPIDTGRYTPSQTEATSAPSGADRQASNLFDAGELLLRCGGRRDFAEGIITQFVSTISKLTDDISTAARSDDATAVAGLAHQFGGAASTMGCRALCTVCTEIETLADHGSTDSVALLLPNLTAIGTQTEDRIGRWLRATGPQEHVTSAIRAAA